MLLINFFYIISIFLPIISILFLIKSKQNKDITVYKNIRIISIIYIIYILINLFILPTALCLDVGLEILFLLPIQIIGVIIYIISIIICSKKIKKIDKNDIKTSKVGLILIGAILLPIIIFMLIFLKEITLLNTSDLLLVYNNSGNGGFGEGKSLVYAIKQNYCKEISVGADFNGYKIEEYCIKTPRELEEYKYNVEYDTINSRDEYMIENINHFSKKDLNYNKVNKAELDYIIRDIKKTHSNVNKINISYLKQSNYYVVEANELDIVFIYKNQSCIHKINLSGNIEIEKVLYFK